MTCPDVIDSVDSQNFFDQVGYPLNIHAVGWNQCYKFFFKSFMTISLYYAGLYVESMKNFKYGFPGNFFSDLSVDVSPAGLN